LAISAAAITVAHSRSATDPQPVPRAVTPFTSFDFGDIYNGEVISQIFVLRNAGDAELRITDFVAGCGCEVVRADRVIPPGKEGTATVEVQTFSQSGKIHKTATLYTNDPERPTIVVNLIANVLKGAPLRRGKYIGPIFLSPDSSPGLYAAADKKATTEFSITSGKPVKVIRVESVNRHFTSRIEEIEPGSNYKIVVESIPTGTGGLYTDQLRVITDSEVLPAFTINLVVRVYDRQ
jgi:hypothetical protein